MNGIGSGVARHYGPPDLQPHMPSPEIGVDALALALVFILLFLFLVLLGARTRIRMQQTAPAVFSNQNSGYYLKQTAEQSKKPTKNNLR